MSAVWNWFKNLDQTERMQAMVRLRWHNDSPADKPMIEAFQKDYEALSEKPKAPLNLSIKPNDPDYIIEDIDGEF